MRCSQCGKEVEEGTKFCTQCGAQLVDDFSKMHDASTVQPTTSIPPRAEPAPAQNRMPLRPEPAPVQAGMPQHSAAPAKDNRKTVILIAAIIGGVALLAIVAVVIVTSVLKASANLGAFRQKIASATESEATGETALNSIPEEPSDVPDFGVQYNSDAENKQNDPAEAAELLPSYEDIYAQDEGSIPLVGTEADAFILPYSDSRYYTAEELRGLTFEELRLARNEIFAYHGRIFSNEELNDYFMSKDWYVPTYEPNDFDPHMDEILNDYEKANVELIKELENGEEEGALYTVTVDAPDDYVNLREGPGTDYRILMPIMNGVVLNIYDEVERGRWLYTEYRGEYGWIAASQVSKN